MKNSILSFLFLCMISFAFVSIPKVNLDKEKDANVLTWQTSFDDAVKLAKKKKKPLLVFFTGSDWCGPCKMLHADLFENEEFITLANKKLILYKADFPRNGGSVVTPEQKLKNSELQSKYGVGGFPTVIMLNAKNEVIGKQVGYNRKQTTTNHLKMINDAIEKYK